jgi:hypothetical protein
MYLQRSAATDCTLAAMLSSSGAAVQRRTQGNVPRGSRASRYLVRVEHDEGPPAFPIDDVAQAAVVGDLNAFLRESHELYIMGRVPLPTPFPPGTVMYRHQDEEARWSAFFPLSRSVTNPDGTPTGPLGTSARITEFTRVSAAIVNGNLHVCTVDKFYRINHAVRTRMAATDSDGIPIPETKRWGADTINIWDDVALSGGGKVGQFVDVSCAGVLNESTASVELHVCAVTRDGHLWHTILAANGQYAPFNDVEQAVGEVGDFRDSIACTGHGTQLYLVGLTQTNGVWMSIRTPKAWRPFIDVKAAMSTPFSDLGPFNRVAIGFCNTGVTENPPRDAAQLNIVLLRPKTGELLHTVFTASPTTWSPVTGATSWMPREQLPDASPSKYYDIALAERPFLP